MEIILVFLFFYSRLRILKLIFVCSFFFRLGLTKCQDYTIERFLKFIYRPLIIGGTILQELCEFVQPPQTYFSFSA